MDREQVRIKVLELAQRYNYIVLEHPTGFGKTLSAMNIIEQNNEFWNIVIAETNHEKNWIDEFKKHGKESLLKKVRFFCYQSLHKYIGEKNFVFDEMHRLLNSDLRLDLLKTMIASNMKKFVGLSATISKNQKYNLNSIVPLTHYYKITMSEAIENNVLPEPTVYLVEINLDNLNKNVKYQFSKDKFRMCTEREWYIMKTSWIDKLKLIYFNSRSDFDKNRWFRAANERKKFLAEVKTKYANILLAKLKEKKLICFANSIDQAKYLSRNKTCIHSKIGKKDREKLLEDFNTGKINKLFAVGMLREGVNLNGIQAGVIIQLDNVERMFTQILGRTIRSNFPELYILYIKDTQDVQYLITCLESFNKDYLQFVNLNNI